jgi:hypothetical protein
MLEALFCFADCKILKSQMNISEATEYTNVTNIFLFFQKTTFYFGATDKFTEFISYSRFSFRFYTQKSSSLQHLECFSVKIELKKKDSSNTEENSKILFT